MNEEEIKKALEIIKQPITVNCTNYHYFDQDNYDNLVRIYDNCLWFIRNFEQLIDNCNELQQENAQLKDKNKKAIDKLEFYNSGEALWYVPIQEIIDILKEN